jgi:hypothetical protein
MDVFLSGYNRALILRGLVWIVGGAGLIYSLARAVAAEDHEPVATTNGAARSDTTPAWVKQRLVA